jgi:PPOX class probable F420-dependent enzyme
MPRMKPADMELFLTQANNGVIATLRSDGRPYTVPIWWLWKDGHIWVVGTTARVWCQQLKRDPRMSLCIEGREPFSGHVEFDGTATARELPDFDIWPIAHELVVKYVGRGDEAANQEAVDKFYTNMLTEPRMLFEIVPEVVRAIDMRVYQGKRGDREYQAVKKAELASR